MHENKTEKRTICMNTWQLIVLEHKPFSTLEKCYSNIYTLELQVKNIVFKQTDNIERATETCQILTVKATKDLNTRQKIKYCH